jgi:hypothetical protein
MIVIAESFARWRERKIVASEALGVREKDAGITA